MAQIVFLDFDGVICDSQNECLVTSYVAYYRYKGETIKNIFTVQISKTIREIFIKYRFLVKPPWQYGILMKLIIEKKDVNLENFRNECTNGNFNQDSYESYFFKTRLEWISKNPDNWYKMNPIYPGVKSNWSKLIKNNKTFILTNKNFDAVAKLLNYYKLDFDNNNIFSKERNNSKAETLLFFSKSYKINRDNINFIDDSSHYVIEMNNLGFQSYLANWGYERLINNTHLIDSENIIDNFKDILGKLQKSEIV